MFKVKPIQPCTKGDNYSISLATNGPVWYVNQYVTFLFECTFGEMILPRVGVLGGGAPTLLRTS